ncbi:MAG: hypothetical protein U1C73_22285 [Dietzia sp.]|nr:hypothetical protein [Dietzia sp.]
MIVDAQTSSTYKVVAVFADGTVTTYTAGNGGGLPVVGPDGTLYAGFADPTNRNYQILVVNPNGTSFVTDSILGEVGFPVLLASDGKAYQVIVTPNTAGTAYEATIVTIDGSTVTQRVVAGTPSSQTVAGPDGAIYYLASGSGGAMTINRVTAGNVATSGPVAGIPVNVPQIDSNGNAYLLTMNQNTGLAQVSVFTAGGATSTFQLAGQPVQSNSFGLSPITVGPDGLVYAPIETGSGAYSVVVLNGTGVVDVIPVGGQPNQSVVFSTDGTPYQVIEGFDEVNSVFFTSVVNLSTGATTQTIEGAISRTGSVQGGSAAPLVFGPDGTGYLLTVRDTGTGFDSTTGLAFDSAGNTVGTFEAVGYVSGVARPNNALGLTVDQFVFADDGTAYATITNTLGQSTGTVVYAMNASGVSKVAEVENGILGSVTVAPDGTVYLSAGVRDEATGTFTTTVQVITPPTSL